MTPGHSVLDRLATSWVDLVVAVVSIIQGLAFSFLAERLAYAWNAIDPAVATTQDWQFLAHGLLSFAILVRVFQTYIVAALDYYDWQLNLNDVILVFVIGFFEYITFSSLTPESFDIEVFHRRIILVTVLGGVGYWRVLASLPELARRVHLDEVAYTRERKLQQLNLAGLVALFVLSAVLILGSARSHPWVGVAAPTAGFLVLLTNIRHSIWVTFMRKTPPIPGPHVARSRYRRLLPWAVVPAAIVFLLFSIVAFRTATVTTRQSADSEPDQTTVNMTRMTDALSAGLKIRTVTTEAPASPARAELRQFRELLESAFPLVHGTLGREVINDLSLLYTWRGTDPELAPVILLAHMDVVDAQPEGWDVPPFSGSLQGELLWGRGALDDKGSLIASLEAVESLLEAKFQPRRTVYLAFGHDEEGDGSEGAMKIALLLGRGRKAAVLLDEGGGVLQGVVPGFSQAVAAVAVAEKGFLDVELTVEDHPGHSSVPPTQTAIAVLSKAISRVQDHPQPNRLTPVVRDMLQYGAAEMSIPLRAVMSNLWLLQPLVLRNMGSDRTTDALVRTTVAPTIISGGDKSNVLPARARAILNIRLLPGDASARVIETISATIADSRVKVHPLERSEAPPVSDIDSDAGRALQAAIRRVFPRAVVLPALSPGTTDSRHYRNVSEQVFRFSPFVMDRSDLARLHGVNERISLLNCARGVRFYRQFIQATQQIGTTGLYPPNR
jgi:carboxypeptidase PM20D1